MFNKFFSKIMNLLATIYCARVPGSLFMIVFRILVREFESVENSPGFARLLAENGGFQK